MCALNEKPHKKMCVDGGLWDDGDRLSDLRTASRRRISRASEGLFRARHPHRKTSRASEGLFCARHPHRRTSRAPEGRFCARHPRRRTSRASEGRFHARHSCRRTFRASAQEYRTGVEIDFPMPTLTAIPLVLAPHLVPSGLKIDFCVNVRSMKHPGNRPDITYSKVSTFLS